MAHLYPTHRRAHGRLRWTLPPLVCLATAACVSVWTPPDSRLHRTTAVSGASAEGAAECVVCHEDVFGRAPIATYHEDCESCHGPGSLHNASEDPTKIRFPSSGDCLSCHETGRNTHLAWTGGEHDSAGVICSDCHDPHNREPNNVRQVAKAGVQHMDASSRMCASCHPDVSARLRLPSHHPVREGMLSCTDCHSPHGDTEVALGASTDRCTGCHQDHAGPWIYEHPPAVEDCSTCHDPHGTASYNLLDTTQPGLCLSCHSLGDSRHFTESGVSQNKLIDSDFPSAVLDINGKSAAITPVSQASVFYSRCSDCHGAIHGSYRDSHLRR